MESRTSLGAEGSVNSVPLEALLDKLVAVHMDLEPACRASGEPADEASDTIVEACKVLHSAVADLRNIIGQVDGMNNPQGLLPVSD
jgi:signal transduction histidine kinase